jgi:hypothetical protein
MKMPSLTAVLKELWSLFVDDGSLAIALVIWVAVCGIGLDSVPIPADWDAPILFLGCLLILILNAMQTIRRKRAMPSDR